MNAPAVGSYYASMVAMDGGSDRERGIAYKLGRLLAQGPVNVSTRAIAELATGDGVYGVHWNWRERGDDRETKPEPKPVAYGTVVRVLERLRRLGVLTWEKAHMLRYCTGPGCETCDSTIRPVRQADGSYRLPARRLVPLVVLWAGKIDERATALRAQLIGTETIRPASPDQPAERVSSPSNSKIKKEGSASQVPIDSAPSADAPKNPRFDALAEAVRAYLDKLRE